MPTTVIFLFLIGNCHVVTPLLAILATKFILHLTPHDHHWLHNTSGERITYITRNNAKPSCQIALEY
jgi:hypothetical protein